MIDPPTLTHHIQKHIVGVLMHQRTARFRDLRPERADTNLFAYHLKLLVKQGMVAKLPDGYTLAANGLSYVDRVNEQKLVIRSQPKIITMLVIQNANGDILLQRRTKQPYIDTWTLPYGKLHIDDRSVVSAAQREAAEKLGLDMPPVVHAGDCYIRVVHDDTILSSTLAHICTFNHDDIALSDTVTWARPHRLGDYRLAPAVEEVVARTFFRDPFFFEEFTSVYEPELLSYPMVDGAGSHTDD